MVSTATQVFVQETEQERHLWVSMSNVMARSVHRLNLSEKRLIALAMTQVDSRVAVTKAVMYRVSALDYAEKFGIAPSTAYVQIKEALEKLWEKEISFVVKNSNGHDVGQGYRWIQAKSHNKNDGYVGLKFGDDVLPHLQGLQQSFTSYMLKHAASFDSVYAWRLFEVLRTWMSTGRYMTTIENFWTVMEAPPSCQKDFGALRKRIIDPAVTAIRAKAGLIVEWKKVTKGSKRVVGLEFRFHKDPQGRLDIEPDEQPTNVANTAVAALQAPTNAVMPRGEPAVASLSAQAQALPEEVAVDKRQQRAMKRHAKELAVTQANTLTG